MVKRIDIAHWPPRRVQNVVMAVACLVVLAVALVFIFWGWRWALVSAIGLGLVVLRPLRGAVVGWWLVNGADR